MYRCNYITITIKKTYLYMYNNNYNIICNRIDVILQY